LEAQASGPVVRSWIHESHPECTYKTGVDSLQKTDFGRKAIICKGNRITESLALRNGEGSQSSDKAPLTSSAWLGRTWLLEPNIMVATYSWEWVVASSSHLDVVQVVELRDHRLVVIQQLEFDTHHGGKNTGADYDPRTKILEIRAVGYSGSEGRCCPSKLKIVKYAWQTNRFHRVSAKILPMPES